MPTALGLLPWTWVDAFPRSPFPAVKRGFLTYRLDCEALAAEGRPAEAAGRQDLAGSISAHPRARYSTGPWCRSWGRGGVGGRIFPPPLVSLSCK